MLAQLTELQEVYNSTQLNWKRRNEEISLSALEAVRLLKQATRHVGIKWHSKLAVEL